MASPHRFHPSSSPPSPVPFVPTTRVETSWDEYLANTSKGPFEFPDCTLPNYDESSNLTDSRALAMPLTCPSTSLRSGSMRPSGSQRRLSPAPSKRMTTTSQKPPPVSFPVATPFPLTLVRPDGIKTFVRPAINTTDTCSNTQVGRWTKKEHELFLEGLQRFGKSWKRISSLVHTRTLVQIRTHAQKYLQKQSRAAIKADFKATGPGASRCRPKPQAQQAQEQPTSNASTFQPDALKISTLQWKSSHSGECNNGYAAPTFPNSFSTLASTSRALSMTSPRSAFQLNGVNKLDQLLQDDNGTIPAFIDEYYTSPTAIEDGLLRPLYFSDQWVAQTGTSYVNKRRRLELSQPACLSTATSSANIGPAIRPAFPSGAFKPLPAPDNLSSPSTSPTQQQSTAAAALLAAHETEASSDDTNAWL